MKIVAAAVQFTPAKTNPACPDFGPIIFTVPAPGRHADILIPLSQLSSDAALGCQQGFLTDEGKFLGRIGAKQLVKDTGQPTIRDCHPTELFSEDLW
jgi:hypothetical protein